jgi:hypothetical protein
MNTPNLTSRDRELLHSGVKPFAILISTLIRPLAIFGCSLALQCAPVLNAGQYQFEQLYSFSTVDIVRNQSLTQAEDGSLLFFPDPEEIAPSTPAAIIRLNTRGNLHDPTIPVVLPEETSLPWVDTSFFDYDTAYGVRDSTIFRAHLDGSDLKVLHSFENFLGGGPFVSSLIDGRDGFLYGMAWGGKTEVPFQILFKLAKDGSTLTVLHNFSPKDPSRSVVLTKGDFLYGVSSTFIVASETWSTDWFRIARGGTNYQDFNFDKSPVLLAPGRDDSIYGASGGNTVFRMNPDGSHYESLHTLATDGSEGANLLTVFEGDDGYIYGTTGALTAAGEITGSGTVFRLRTDGRNFEIIYHFSNDLLPTKYLIEGFDGSLYGVTQSRSQPGADILFTLRPPVLPPPRILELRKTPRETVIRFSSSAFSTNEILGADSITGPWQFLINTVVPLNSVSTVTDSALSSAQFYRIRRN